MKCSRIQKNAEKVTSVFDQYQSDNPLLVRKKFQMKDSFFRKDHPEVEVLRCEVAWDVELYVLLLVLASAGAFLLLKTVSCCIRAGRRRELLAAHRAKQA